MAIATVGSFSDLIEVLVTAVSILGGLMAFYSGREAWLSLEAHSSPARTAHRVNQGLARGFARGFPLAVIVSVTLALF